MATDNTLSLLGIAMKAGKVVSGEFSVENAVRKGRAHLVIVAADASDNTKKNFQNMCIYYKVPCYVFGDKTELGRAIGKQFRASVAVLDENLGKAVAKQIDKKKGQVVECQKSECMKLPEN